MSKQSEAKKAQGYVQKAVPTVCAGCMYFKSEFVTVSSNYGVYEKEKNLRCEFGGFAVKKMGTCRFHKPKMTLGEQT